MIARALQWIGGFALLAVGAAGVGSLALVKDRLDVTIREHDSSPEPDPLALVRDDLQQLHADLAAIAGGLDTNLGRLGEALDASARDNAGLRAELTRLAARVDEFAERAAEPVCAAAVAATAPIEEPPAVAQAAPIEAPPVEAPPIEEPPAAAPTVEPEAAPPPAATPASRGFLSFRLPSSVSTFDVPQHYRILASLSRVGFDAKSTLHDFSGVTSKVEGDVHANLADPESPWHGTISCDAAALDTGVAGRDEGMREHLDTDHHAQIRFEVTGFRAAPDGIDVAAGRARGTVTGRMTIRGQTREIEMPVEITTDPSRRIVVDGQAPLKLTDYGIPVPNKLGLVSMEDQVTIWISLRARSVGDAEESARDG